MDPKEGSWGFARLLRASAPMGWIDVAFCECGWLAGEEAVNCKERYREGVAGAVCSGS